MPSRLAIPLALVFGLAVAYGTDIASARPAETREGDRAASAAARDRQKRCANAWRAMSVAEKSARGPAWPQFYSACVKRLKEPKS